MDVKETAVLSVLGIDTNVSELDAASVYKNLAKIGQLMDILEKQKETLRQRAFQLAEQMGEKDDKGSAFVKLPDGTWFKKEARTSVKIKQDKAVELFKEKGLDNRLTVNIKNLDPKEVEEYLPDHLVEKAGFIVDDADVEQAFYAGEITDEELQQLVERKTTYALKIKPLKN